MEGVLYIIALAAVLSVVAEFVINPAIDRVYGKRPDPTDDELGTLDGPEDAS